MCVFTIHGHLVGKCVNIWGHGSMVFDEGAFGLTSWMAKTYAV